MAIVSCNLLWRNLWCKKEKRGFKEVYQLSDLSPLTSTPPTSLPDSHPSPSPLKFSLKSTAHRVTQCCRGLKERCWRRVIGQSERVGVGSKKWLLNLQTRREGEALNTHVRDHVWPLYAPPFYGWSACVWVGFVEPPLCYPHRLFSWLLPMCTSAVHNNLLSAAQTNSLFQWVGGKWSSSQHRLCAPVI